MPIFLLTSVTVYGGIYMDWDQVVLRSLDDLRNYDVTMVRSSKKGFWVHSILFGNLYLNPTVKGKCV